LLIAFLVLILALSIVSPAFFSSRNLLNIVRQTSINGMIGVGMTFVIISGGIDLSVGAIVALAAVVSTSFAHPGQAVFLAVLIGIAVGLGGGALNGLIVSRGGVAPFIATLGMMTVMRGLALVITGGRPVINVSDGYNLIGGGYLIGIPIPIIIFIIIVLAGIFLLSATRYGRYVYAVGGNVLSAKVSGINTRNISASVFVISGILAGVAGVVLAARVKTGSPVAGLGYELDAIAAVVIGGTSLSGGIGSVFGTFIECFFLFPTDREGFDYHFGRLTGQFNE
jgi:ribose/xylose/arabinose/galactoside ABC-type transport system permease subunit